MLCIFLCTQLGMAQNDISSTTQVQSIFDEFLKYRHQNRMDKALEALNQASEIAENNEDAKLLLDTYHQYARIYLEEGDKETALFYWDRASMLLNIYGMLLQKDRINLSEEYWLYPNKKVLFLCHLLQGI
ncbi:MAG: tetratricopeptide repeat protein, partial [Bacteroidota bacterium]